MPVHLLRGHRVRRPGVVGPLPRLARPERGPGDDERRSGGPRRRTRLLALPPRHRAGDGRRRAGQRAAAEPGEAVLPRPHRAAGRRVQHRDGGRRDRSRRCRPHRSPRRSGADGWRWALGIWAVFALLAAVPWLFVPANPGASRGTHTAVRMRDLRHSRMALALHAVLRRPGHGGLHHHRLVGAVPPRRGADGGRRRAAARPEPGDRHPAERPRPGADGAATPAAAAAARVHGLLRHRVDRTVGRPAHRPVAVDDRSVRGHGELPDAADPHRPAGPHPRDDRRPVHVRAGLGVPDLRRRPAARRRAARRDRQLHGDVRPRPRGRAGALRSPAGS